MARIDIEGFNNCVELVSDDFRIAVTTEVGPRVIFGSIAGSPNIFRLMPQEPLPGIDTGFLLYGGHRLWHSPEVSPRTYAPDNAEVKVTNRRNGTVVFSSGIEELTGIEKSIAIKPLGDNCFELTHRLVNRGQWRVELAAWALSVMAQGGEAIIPFSRDPDGNPYAVDRTLNLWPYCEFTDPRLTIGTDYLRLRQDPDATTPCKVGVNCAEGWVAYAVHNVALVKHFAYFADAEYPDKDSCVESYTCPDFCEIETVGPLHRLAPGEELEHTEVWQGLADVGELTDEDSITESLANRVYEDDEQDDD